MRLMGYCRRVIGKGGSDKIIGFANVALGSWERINAYMRTNMKGDSISFLSLFIESFYVLLGSLLFT